MAAGEYNFVIEKGVTFRRRVTILDSTGAAVSLVGATAKLQARATDAATEEILALTHASGLTLGGAAGTVDIAVTAGQSAAILLARLVYALQITLSNGDILQPIHGQITFIENRIQ